jgi:soluble lytic murein transglycosylase-like protein
VIVLATPKPQSPYEQLKAAYKAVPVPSANAVRANLDNLSGRVVEIKGVVSGFLTMPQGRTLMLKTDESTTTMASSLQLNSDADSLKALRPGTTVRVLAMVNEQNTEAAPPLLSALSATDQMEAEKLFRDEEVENNDDLIVVPPMTSMVLPPPQKTQPAPKPSTTQPTSLPKSTLRAPADAAERAQWIETQLPAFKTIVRQHNKKLKEAQVEEIARALVNAGYANNMDPRFLAAIIAVESDFDIYCLSSSGAMGLGQLMPFNLKEAGVTDAWNPTQNIHGAARLLRGHMNDYKNRADGTLLAVAAYNAGPGAVRRAGYKVPNGQQVQRYVWKVYHRYKAFAPDMFD